MPDLTRDLVTRRLVLEPLIAAHACLLFGYLQDRRLYRYYADEPPSTVEMLEHRYRGWETRKSPDRTQTWLNYAVRRTDGGYVGWIQATILGDAATIGYDIFPEFWRQGYATEACGELLRALREDHVVRTISATVDSGNAASIRLLEHLGFTRTWTGPSDDMPGHTDHRYEWRPMEDASAGQTSP